MVRFIILLIITASAFTAPASAQSQGPFKQYCNYDDQPNGVFFLGPCTVKYVEEGDKFFALYQMKNKILRIQLNLSGGAADDSLFKNVLIADKPGFDVEVDRTHHIFIREDRKLKFEVQDHQKGMGTEVVSSF